MRKRQTLGERQGGRERPGETTWQEVQSDIDDGTPGSSEDERWRKTLHTPS